MANRLILPLILGHDYAEPSLLYFRRYGPGRLSRILVVACATLATAVGAGFAGDVFPTRTLPTGCVSSASAYTTRVSIAISAPAPSAYILEEVLPSGWAITQATWKSSPFMPTKTGTTNKWVFGISPPVETGTLVYVTLPTNAFERTYQIAGSAKYLQGPSEIIRVTAGDTLLHSCDRDADGMPDDWERAFGLNPTNTADAGQHGDSDGLHNLAEYLADTNPTNPDSVLSVIAIQPESGGVRIEWRGGVQATQYAERRSDLSQTSETWTAFLTNLPPTLLTNYVIDAEATNETRFYRIKAERK